MLGGGRKSFFVVFCVTLLCGCVTQPNSFVAKTEEELDAMEQGAERAAELFREGRYGDANAVLNNLAFDQTVSQPLYRLDSIPCLLLSGRSDEAYSAMRELRKELEELYNLDSERKASSKWHGEVNKVFKGSPHEMGMFYALMSLSCAERGEYEDAWRCVQNGLLHDCDSEHQRYQSDFALLLYLGSVYSAMLGETDATAQCRKSLETALRIRGAMPDGKNAHDSPVAVLFGEMRPNAMIVVWTGTPPKFGRGGEHGEKRTILRGEESSFDFVTMSDETGGERTVPQRLGDINYQASTRGGRLMDGVLQDKADFKGDLQSYSSTAHRTSDAFHKAGLPGDPFAKTVGMVIGATSSLVGDAFSRASMAVDAHADIRSWRTLPGQLDVLPLCMPPGPHDIVLRGYVSGKVVLEKKVRLAVPNDRGIGVVHVMMDDESTRRIATRTRERGRNDKHINHQEHNGGDERSRIVGVWRSWIDVEDEKSPIPNDSELLRRLPTSGEITMELVEDGSARVMELEGQFFGQSVGTWKYRPGMLELQLQTESGQKYKMGATVAWKDEDSFSVRYMMNDWRDLMNIRTADLSGSVTGGCTFKSGKMRAYLVRNGGSPGMAARLCTVSIFRRQWGLRTKKGNTK